VIRRDIAACGMLCALVAVLALATRVPASARVEAIVPLVGLAHLAWVGATRARPRRATVLGVTVVLAALCAFARPVAEDDYWRFLWDGYRTLTDGTPYGHAPVAWFGDPSLPATMQTVLDGINHPEVPTIYGPLLQALFLGAHLVAPGDPSGLSILFGAVHVACSALAMRFVPAHRVALVAWNPLLLHQCLINLHPDFLVGWLLLGAAIAARRAAAARAAAVLAMAVATKVSAFAAAPVLWIAAAPAGAARRANLVRGACAGLATLAIVYLPWFVMSGTEGPGLATFAAAWRFNPALFAPLAAILGDSTARLVAAAIVGTFVAGLAAGATPRRAFASTVLALAALLAFSPVVNAWYLAWLLPCAAITRWRAPWVAAAALGLSALTAGELGLPGDPFAVPGAVVALQWAMIAAAVAVDLNAHRRRRRLPAAPASSERPGAKLRSESAAAAGHERSHD
jgi:hypothetical protein